jgi:hypothetical protein
MKPLKLLFKLLLSSLLISTSIAILPVPATTLDELVNNIVATDHLEPIVNNLFDEKKSDLPFLNELRLRLKAKDEVEKSVELFKKLYLKDKNNKKTGL